MDIYKLREMHLRKHPNSHWFDTETMKFFGESLSTMQVLKKPAKVTDICGNQHTCFVVSKIGKDAFWNRRRSYAYFDVETLEYIIISERRTQNGYRQCLCDRSL